MKNLRLWTLRSLALVVIGITTSGCVWLALGAGAGAAVWAKGELKSVERAHLSDTIAATKQALEAIEYDLIKLQETELSAEFEARGADETVATVKLRRLDVRDTEVRIRFGVMGNEEYSRLLLEKIQRRIH